MKVRGATNFVAHQSNEKQFTVKASGICFRILSSGLYKDKILAIIRELSCNAYDAHIMAGKQDTPFDVILPYSDHPYFVVKDHGPGMSPNDMEDIFCTYFESTKNSTNDQIGGYGLGCKSPLSYVDRFKVISKHDGKKNTYEVFFDEHDIPSLAHIHEENCYNDTGLEIIVPAKSHDFEEFRIRSEKIFETFVPHPNIIAGNRYVKKEREVVIEGPNFRVFSDKGGSDGIRAKMGVVCYPIDSSSLNFYDLSGLNIDIDFPIGELETTAGRETLSYTAATKKALLERLAELRFELASLIVTNFARCVNEYDARKLHGQYTDKTTAIDRIFPNNSVPFRGKLIERSAYFFDLKNMPKTRVYNFDRDGKHTFVGTCQPGKKDSNIFSVPVSDNARVIIDDVGAKQVNKRIENYKIRNNLGGNGDVYLFVPGSLEERDTILQHLDGYPILYLSSIPVPERVRVTKEKTPEVSVLALSSRHIESALSYFTGKDWKQTSIHPDAPNVCYYVESVGKNPIFEDEKIDLMRFGSAYCDLKRLKLIDKIPVFMIPNKAGMKAIRNKPNWVNLFDAGRDAFMNFVINEQIEDKMARSKAKSEFETNLPFNFNEMNDIALGLVEDHPLRTFADSFAACRLERFDYHVSLATFYGIELQELEYTELDQIWNKVDIDQYPLLKYILWARTRISQDQIRADAISYIKEIDATRDRVS